MIKRQLTDDKLRRDLQNQKQQHEENIEHLRVRFASPSAISGNIGSGKTTLCKYIEEVLEQSMVIYERFEENEHLARFYDHLKQNGINYNPYSYPTQLKFLQSRMRQENEIFGDQTPVQQGIRRFVVDRSIFEDSSVFAKSQFKAGLMNEHEYSNYRSFFEKNLDKLRLPELVIYLKLDIRKLHQRIQKRGREMEKDLSEEYLKNLQNLYEDFIQEMKLKGVKILEIDTETRDDYPKVIEAINSLSTFEETGSNKQEISPKSEISAKSN